jgi:hypothetical protein
MKALPIISAHIAVLLFFLMINNAVAQNRKEFAYVEILGTPLELRSRGTLEGGYQGAEAIRAGSPFYAVVFVDHNVAGEVSVFSPHLDGDFLITQVKTFTRHITASGKIDKEKSESGEQSRVWTVYEYTLIPIRSGQITLGAFRAEILSDNDFAEYFTQPVNVFIESNPLRAVSGTTANETLKLVWEKSNITAKTGEISYLYLKPAQKNLDISESLLQTLEGLWLTPPPELIIEMEKLSAAEKNANYLLKICIIPLKRPAGGKIELPARQGERFSIPTVTITVLN